MVSVKPAAINSSAITENQVSLTVTYLEQYKKPKKCFKQTPIQTTVSYSTGELKLNGSTVFVPVVATITAVYLHCNGTTTSKSFVETFDISFQGNDLLSTTATIVSLGRTSDVSSTCCGITNLLIDDSITITVD